MLFRSEIGGTGVLTNKGLMTWEGGTIGVEFKGLALGEVTNNGTLRIIQTGTLSGILNNNAEKQIQVESDLSINGGDVFNDGEIDFASGFSNAIDGDANAAIFNTGRIRVSPGKGGALSGNMLLDNTGVVRVDQNATMNISCDVVQLNDGCLEGGTWIVLSGGSLELPGNEITKLGAGTEVELAGAFDDLASLDEVDQEAKFLVEGDVQLSDSVTNLGLTRIQPAGAGEGDSVLDVDGNISNEVNNTTGIMGDMEHDLVIAAHGSGGDFNGFICENLNNNANVHPGGEGETGPFNVKGNFNQGETGVLNVDIAGSAPVGQHDQLEIEGNAALAGSLDVGFINDFEPQIGDAFTIITASPPGSASNDIGSLITGTFDHITGEGLWNVTYSDTSVIITYQGESPLGDIDNDGMVSVNDLLQLLSAWGSCPGCSADLDNNGNVGVNDLLVLLANWG